MLLPVIERPLVKNSTRCVNSSLPLRCAQVSGDYGKCCVWTAPILGYMHLPLFLAASTPNSKLSLLQRWHSRGQTENLKFLMLLHVLSVYLNRILLFVCCSKFTWNIQLFLYRITVQLNRHTYRHSQQLQSGYFLTLSFLSFHLQSYRTNFTGSSDRKNKQRHVRLHGRKKHEHNESLKTNFIA